MEKLTYELRFHDGLWQVRLGATILFSFSERADALARLDDLVMVGARGREIEVRLYDETGALVSRQTAQDYSI